MLYDCRTDVKQRRLRVLLVDRVLPQGPKTFNYRNVGHILEDQLLRNSFTTRIFESELRLPSLQHLSSADCVGFAIEARLIHSPSCREVVPVTELQRFTIRGLRRCRTVCVVWALER